MGRVYREPADTFFSLDETSTLCVRPPVLGISTINYLNLTGDGSLVDSNMNGNYSASLVDFYNLVTSAYDVYTILTTISDNGSFNQTDYGAIPTGTITNGLKFFIYNANFNLTIPLLRGKGFTKNHEWFEFTTDASISTFAGTSQTLKVAFNVLKDYGLPLRLNPGDKFIVRLNDNFTGLVSQTVTLLGTQQLSPSQFA